MEAKDVRDARAKIHQRERDFVQRTISQGRELRRQSAAAATQEQRVAQGQTAQQRVARVADDAEKQGLSA